ncbi:MAG: hypothetical protein ACO28O_04855 [Crocinitomicaceae bacterium]|jgi:chemotaxis methyl-accepting protein methylase
MKTIFLTLALMLSVFSAQADQLIYLTEEQANTAQAYLSNEAAVILWCGCCEGEEARGVMIESVEVQATEDGYFMVVINGVDHNGEAVSEAVDLAYVHVVIENTAYCLGQVLEYECDPCIEPFSIEE